MSEVIHRPNNDGLTPIQYPNSKPSMRSLQAEVDELRRQDDEITAQLAETTKGLLPAKLSDISIVNSYTDVLPIEVIGNVIWGVKGNYLWSSTDKGLTWTSRKPIPSSAVHTLIPTTDNEMIICNATSVWKSSNWNGTTTTWNLKVTKSAAAGTGIRRWGIDGDGTKFIATEYSTGDRTQSRYVWISTDKGSTWNVVVDKHVIDPENTSHMHGVCYDKWADRFFLSHGHGVLRGVYYSDDNGATWTKIGGDFQPDAAPTTLTATDDGIVCGSDSGDAGLYGIIRTSDPTKMEMKPIARWHVGRAGVTGFASRPFRDEKTGNVYVSFKSDYADVKSAILAGTAKQGTTVWEDNVSAVTIFDYNVVVDNVLLGVITDVPTSTNKLIRAKTNGFSSFNYDRGNTTSGESRNSTSIAMGNEAKTNNPNEVLIGNKAKTNGLDNGVAIGAETIANTRSTVIGSKAQALTTDSVVIGSSAVTEGGNSIVIGVSASTYPSATASTVIGKSAKATFASTAIGSGAQAGTVSGHTNAVAIGYNATSGSIGVAIGHTASAGTGQVAIGQAAIANHSNSVAIGKGISTTANEQVNFGAKHIELQEVAVEPASVPANSGRLFLKDNGAGKTQLCVRLGATTIVLATEG